MDLLKQSLKQVKQVLFFVSFFNSFVNSVIVLLLFTLAFFFFNFSWIYALIPFGLFLIVNTVRGMRKIGYYDVEKKIPDLEWRLRTSADNADRNDELAMDLHHDVLEKLHQVSATRIMNKKQTISKMTAILGLCLLLGFVSLNSIHFDDVLPSIREGTNSFTGFFAKTTNLSDVSFFDDKQEDTLYGDEEQIDYGGKEQVVELNQMLGLADVNNYTRNGEGKTFKGGSTGTGNREALGSENSKENINEEDQQIVKKYFDTINQP